MKKRNMSHKWQKKIKAFDNCSHWFLISLPIKISIFQNIKYFLVFIAVLKKWHEYKTIQRICIIKAIIYSI